jgi:hypothetical protein
MLHSRIELEVQPGQERRTPGHKNDIVYLFKLRSFKPSSGHIKTERN